MNLIPLTDIYEAVKVYTRRNLSEYDLRLAWHTVARSYRSRLKGAEQLVYRDDTWVVTDTLSKHPLYGYVFPVTFDNLEIFQVNKNDTEHTFVLPTVFNNVNRRFPNSVEPLCTRIRAALGNTLPASISDFFIPEVGFDRITIRFRISGMAPSYYEVYTSDDASGEPLIYAGNVSNNYTEITVGIEAASISGFTIRAFNQTGQSIEYVHSETIELLPTPTNLSGITWGGNTRPNPFVEFQMIYANNDGPNETTWGQVSVATTLDPADPGPWESPETGYGVQPVGYGGGFTLINSGAQPTIFDECYLKLRSVGTVHGAPGRRWYKLPTLDFSTYPDLPTDEAVEVELYRPITPTLPGVSNTVSALTVEDAIAFSPNVGEGQHDMHIGYWAPAWTEVRYDTDPKSAQLVQVVESAAPIIQNALCAEILRMKGWDERVGIFQDEVNRLLEDYNLEGRRAKARLTKRRSAPNLDLLVGER